MLKKFAIGLGVFVITVYVLFLVIPFFLNGLANSYNEQISKMIEDSSGFKVKLENIKILTTPKLTIGAGVEHIEVALPTGETFLTADNTGGKLSLIPLLVRKIEIDAVGAENVNLNLKIKKDGKFLIEDYIPQEEPQESQKEQTVGELPLGLKLSNRLPNIIVKNYNISFIDMPSDKTYSIYGEKFAIEDFILNKKIKLTAVGKVMLQDREQFNYDVKILNKIMPDLDLNDIIFNSQPNEEQAPSEPLNLVYIFKTIHNNQFMADIKADVKTSGTLEDVELDGNIDVSNLKIAVDGKLLPSGNVDLDLKGNSIKLYSKLFTAQNEITELVGNFKTGKHSQIDLNCKSNLKFKSLIDMIDSIAKTFGYHELDTMSATGGIDADFTVKSNLKKLESSGYLKIPSASLNYKLYNIALDNIKADIDFSNNMVNIKDAGFSILEQPLKLKGTLTQDANADISLFADKLSLKGLLLALGQTAILKDNKINNGTLSMNVLLKGRLDKIIPKVNVSIDNVNVKNIPSDTTLILANSKIDLETDVAKTKGLITAVNTNIINPALSISVPEVNLSLGDKDIDIKKAYLLFNGSRVDISGKISDYLAQNIKLNIKAVGLGTIHLTGSINDIAKSQKLELSLKTLDTVSMSIPGFKKSNIKTDFDINILGSAINPILKGNIKVPTLNISDIPVSMQNLNILLNGSVLKGSGTLQKFMSCGIVGENLVSDFHLTNNVFYLKNIKGDAFSGKINGNISYNLSNGHIGVDLNGSGMNAENAILGAAGLKNALSGTLGFSANVTLFGANDIEMMKNLKGKVAFEITDGTLGNIGRFENLLFAQNLQSNSIIKAAINSVSALPAIKNTAQFKNISGNLTFNNGWANLNPIKTSGPSMAYYITGKYNLLNSTANVIILGRISAEIVSLLGPLGDLSVTKLTSYIPKFGTATGNIINALTANPKGENVAAIPQLSSGNKNYKDFKVQFNGGVESKSSVKSFKWLSVCDMSAIQKTSVQEQINNTKQAVKDAVQEKKDAFNAVMNNQKQQAQDSKQQLDNAVQGLKNLKNILK